MVCRVIIGVVAISLGFFGCLRLLGNLEKRQRRTDVRRQKVQRQREEFWRSV